MNKFISIILIIAGIALGIIGPLFTMVIIAMSGAMSWGGYQPSIQDYIIPEIFIVIISYLLISGGFKGFEKKTLGRYVFFIVTAIPILIITIFSV